MRIDEREREHAIGAIERGGRGQPGEVDRGSFRVAAQAIQDVGLGLLVGEDLALGALARSASDEIVRAGMLHRLGRVDRDFVSFERQFIPNPATRASSIRRALLIGSQAGGLEGVSHDVQEMRAELDAREFTCVELVGGAATRVGILSALRELKDTIADGDAVVVYYSGRAGRHPSADDREKPTEPLQGFLVPIDATPPVIDVITELELAEIFDEIAGRTDNVTLIFDANFGPVSSNTYVDLHPNIVQIVATGVGGPSFEQPDPDDQPSGVLTSELCAALAAARATSADASWDSIIRRVREHVSARLRMRQRPELVGPRWRLAFSLKEVTHDSERFSLLFSENGTPWLDAGRLHGLQAGDLVEIRDMAGIPARGRVIELLDDIARLELDLVPGRPQPQLGSVATPLRLATRRTVRVDPDALRVEGLVSEIERSSRVWLVEEQESDFRVSIDSDRLLVSGAPWLRRVARPMTPPGIAELAADLDGLARAEILLAALQSSPGLDAASTTWGFSVMLTEPGGSTPRTLVPNEILSEGTRLYVELRSPSPGSPLYVNILDRGVTGHLTLVNQAEPAGARLGALETRWVGRRRYGGPPGMVLRWPSIVPRTEVGSESLFVVASSHPLDLRCLLEGPWTRPTRGADQPSTSPIESLGTPATSEGPGPRAEPAKTRPGEPLAWTVSKVEFGVRP